MVFPFDSEIPSLGGFTTVSSTSLVDDKILVLRDGVNVVTVANNLPYGAVAVAILVNVFV